MRATVAGELKLYLPIVFGVYVYEFACLPSITRNS